MANFCQHVLKQLSSYTRNLVPQMFTADCRVCCLIDRSDKTLEDIIYKLVPKLQESKTFKCMKTVTINLTLNRPI